MTFQVIIVFILTPAQTYITFNCGIYYVIGLILHIPGIKLALNSKLIQDFLFSPINIILPTLSVPHMLVGKVLESTVMNLVLFLTRISFAFEDYKFNTWSSFGIYLQVYLGIAVTVFVYYKLIKPFFRD